MIQRLLSATLLLLFAVCSRAQQPVTTDSSITLSAAFNAEQMLEKMGFDNLMKAIFNGKEAQKNQQSGNAEKNIKLRKALAAMYGAGINFNKKIWVINRQQNKTGGALASANYKDYETPLNMLVVPVASRAVMQENIEKLLQNGREGADTLHFTNNGAVAWMQDGKSLLLLSNTELVVAALPRKIYSYNDDAYYAPSIKTDTIITPRQKEWAGDETIEEVEKPSIIEIDKLQSNGKIKRLYTYKDKNTLRFTPPKITEEIKEEIAAVEDSAVAVVETVADTAVIAVEPATDITERRDTLTRTEFLNDSMYVTHYYLAFTSAAQDSINKKMEEQKELEQQLRMQQFIKEYNMYLPAADNALQQQMAADTADIVLHSSVNGASPYSFLSSAVFGAVNKTLLSNQPAAITSINFENGKMQMTSTYNAVNGNTPAAFTNMYKAIAGFWPAALGNAPMGHIQFNADVQQLLTFLTSTAGGAEKIEREMKREGLDYKTIPQLFTGQVAMSVHNGLSPRGKKQPRLLIALQLNNAAAAVDFMNRMGSKKTKFTNSYRFDENAQYLLFDTDAKNGLLKQPATAAAPKSPAAPAGALVFASMNIKAMLQAFTKESKKKEPAFKQAQQFFGAVKITAVKNAGGQFLTSFTADMGSTQTNALYNLLQFMSSTGGSGSGVFPPLGRMLR